MPTTSDYQFNISGRPESVDQYQARIALLRQQNQGTRNLQLQSGDTAALLDLGNRSAKNVAESVPSGSAYQQFGLALMKLLQDSQRLGTKPLAEQQFAAREEQTKRTLAQTPQELIGASPGLQAGVRSAAAEAIQPTITGLGQQQKTFQEQITGFGNILGQARNILKTYQDSQNQLQSTAKGLVELALKGGSEGLEALLREQPEIFKAAGFDTKTVQGLIPAIKAKDKELAGGGDTAGERKSQLQAIAIAKARPVLEQAKIQHGFVDTALYQKLRLDYGQVIGNVSEFDDAFSSMLSPQDRANLGIGKAVGVQAEESTGTSVGEFWSWLSNQF